MDRDALRGYLDRDRASVESNKRAYHVQRYRLAGATFGLDANAGLREWVRRVRPDWPTARDRADDLAHHVTLKALLDRCADAFAVR